MTNIKLQDYEKLGGRDAGVKVDTSEVIVESKPKPKLYSERNAYQLDKLGGFYCKHVQAMTDEGLRDKSDIAAELGYRDALIETLRDKLWSKYHKEACDWGGSIENAVDFANQAIEELTNELRR